MNELVPLASTRVPFLAADDGARLYRFFEFFTPQIRNPINVLCPCTRCLRPSPNQQSE